MQFRIAKSTDLPSIVDIYNQAIQTGTATADVEEFKLHQKLDWFNKHIPQQYPISVVTISDKVVAWGSISPYREGRKALNKVIEISYYVDYNFHRKGIGHFMLTELINQAKSLNYEYAVALLLEVNSGSIKLLENQGFLRIGLIPSVVKLANDQRCGHLIYGYKLKKD